MAAKRGLIIPPFGERALNAESLVAVGKTYMCKWETQQLCLSGETYAAASMRYNSVG